MDYFESTLFALLTGGVWIIAWHAEKLSELKSISSKLEEQANYLREIARKIEASDIRVH